jgi:hypothetical protein
MFRLYMSHLQALNGQIHTIREQCIVVSPTLTIICGNNTIDEGTGNVIFSCLQLHSLSPFPVLPFTSIVDSMSS